MPLRLSVLFLAPCCESVVSTVALRQRAFEARLDCAAKHFAHFKIISLPPYFKPPSGTELCWRQALDNLIQWYKLDGAVPPIGPLGFVPHPRKQSLAASLGFVKVLNETVLVVNRYIRIKLRRLKFKRSRFWFRESKYKSSRLTARFIKIDTHTCRRRVGDGIVATKGRVLYDAGPLVDYNAIARD